MPKQTKKQRIKKSVLQLNAKNAQNDPNNPQKKKRGSPSQYPIKVEPYINDIARYTRCGVTEGQLCEYYGVGKTQWAQYKKDNPEFAETLLKAKQEFKTDLINKSYEVAMGYHYTEVTTTDVLDDNGVKIGVSTKQFDKYAKPDSGMLQFLLINRFTAEFARDPQMVELRKKALELAENGKMPPDGGEGF